jgi:nicotinate (nicotinamide) nucleotide adenylyltransferase
VYARSLKIHTKSIERLIDMKIAVGGSAANPPHFGHKQVVEAVVKTSDFNQVLWIVSGDRPDKPGLPDSKIRWQMGKMLFANNKYVSVLYEQERAVPTCYVIDDLQTQYPLAKIVWYCGADHFVPRQQFRGKCDILGFWDKGKHLFENQEFLIIPRKGIDMGKLQLPQKYQILDVQIPEISSTKIRHKIKAGKKVTETLPEIVKHIKKNNLYR